MNYEEIANQLRYEAVIQDGKYGLSKTDNNFVQAARIVRAFGKLQRLLNDRQATIGFSEVATKTLLECETLLEVIETIDD